MKIKHQTIAAVCAFSLNHASAQTADVIYHGGPVITINDSAPRAEAVAVKDGRILAVGKKDDVLKKKGDATKLVDLAGHAMLPGFVDAHGHVFGGETLSRALAAAARSKPFTDLGLPIPPAGPGPGCNTCLCVFLSDMMGAMATSR